MVSIILLIANGSFLAVLLLVLLSLLSKNKNSQNVREDIKKIKSQISGVPEE